MIATTTNSSIRLKPRLAVQLPFACIRMRAGVELVAGRLDPRRVLRRRRAYAVLKRLGQQDLQPALADERRIAGRRG